MEGFKTFTQAVDMASDFCSVWKNIEANEEIGYEDMMETALYLDACFPLVGDIWYGVFEEGSIGMINEYTKEITIMFSSIKSEPIKHKLYMDDDKKYCISCGTELPSEAQFCSKCGKKVA